MATLTFDANTVEPSSGKDPVPAGKYVVAIVESTMKPTKNGAGHYLELEYQILEAEHKGRRLWSRHNLQHPSAQAVEIARSELSAICRAVGVMTPKDSHDLHGLPLTVTVRQKPRQDTGEATTEVVAWAKRDAAAAPKPATAASTPPWGRRA